MGRTAGCKSFYRLAALAGLLYALLLCFFCVADVVAAGQPAEMAWQVVGGDPRTMALHRMWLLVARLAVAPGIFSPEVALNALSAVLGGAALSGVLIVSHRLLACAMSSASAAGNCPASADDAVEDGRQCRKGAREVVDALTADFSRNERLALMAGTAAAGAAFAFMAPLWVAATRAGPAIFDILLVLLAVWVASAFCLYPCPRSAIAASVIAGAGLAECPLFPVIGVALAIFCMRAVLRNGLDAQRYFLLAAGTVSAAFLLQLAIVACLPGEPRAAAVPLTQTLRAMLSGYQHEFLYMLAPAYRMWSVLWVLMPFAMAVSLSLSAQPKTGWSYVACLALWSVVLASALLNLPYTPWRIWRGSGEISVMAALLAVYACGFLAGQWWLLATASAAAAVDQQDDAKETGRGAAWLWLSRRAAGVGGLVLLAVLLICQPLRNWRIVAPRALQAQTVAEHDVLGPLAAGDFALPAGAGAEALAAMAMTMLDGGHYEAVERVIMPRLLKLKPPLERDRMELLRARVLMVHGSRGLGSARIFLLRLLPRGLPEQAEIGEWLLQSDVRRQDWALAERDAQTIRKIMPMHPLANEVLARAMIKRGALRLAVGHLHQALQCMTNSALLAVRGEAAYRLGEMDEALGALRQAVRLPDAGSDAYLYLAKALLRQGSTNEAHMVLDGLREGLLDPELLLLHAELLCANANAAACRHCLQQLEAMDGRLTLAQRRRRAALLAQIATAASATETR